MLNVTLYTLFMVLNIRKEKGRNGRNALRALRVSGDESTEHGGPARRFPASSRASWWAERSRGNHAEDRSDSTMLATPTVRDLRFSSPPPVWD